MADEATITVSLRFSKGSSLYELSLPQAQSDVDGTKATMSRQTLGDTSEALDLGEVTAGGWFLCINRGTEIVRLLTALAGAQFAQINAGEGCLLRLDPAVSVHGKTDSGTSDVEFLAVSL